MDYLALGAGGDVFPGPGGLLPLPFPDEFPVLAGPFGGVNFCDFDILVVFLVY